MRWINHAHVWYKDQEKSVGYIGWSGDGNGDDWKYIDIVNDWSGNSLSELVNVLLYHKNGMKNTSKTCTVYTSSQPSADKITVEAENGSANGIYDGTSRPGYFGNGYITGFDNGNDYV